jgi:hypothetical protein
MYPAVLGRIRQYHEDFTKAEREVIGFSHPLVGALLADKWKLPLRTCQAILHYADPKEGLLEEHEEKVCMLRLSTGMGMAARLGCPEGHPLDMEEIKLLANAVGVDEANAPADYLEEARCATQARFKAEASAY